MDQQINRETATREEQQKITRADKHGKTEEDSAFFDFQDGLGFDFLSEIPSELADVAETLSEMWGS